MKLSAAHAVHNKSADVPGIADSISAISAATCALAEASREFNLSSSNCSIVSLTSSSEHSVALTRASCLSRRRARS